MFTALITSDETWLNTTNALLGIVTLICIGVVGYAVLKDVTAWARRRAAAREHFVYDDHTMAIPELGLTMADGGEPHDDKRNTKS